MKLIKSLSARDFIFAVIFVLILYIPPPAHAITAQQVISPNGGERIVGI